MLAITKHVVREMMGTFPDDSQVWGLTRHKDFNKVFRAFMWKLLHNTHKIGHYWDNIDNYGHQANCQKCRTTESLEHFLLHCDIPGQKVIRKGVQEL